MTEVEIRALLASRPHGCDCSDSKCTQPCARTVGCPGWLVRHDGHRPCSEWCEDCWPVELQRWWSQTDGRPDQYLPEAYAALVQEIRDGLGPKSEAVKALATLAKIRNVSITHCSFTSR